MYVLIDRVLDGYTRTKKTTHCTTQHAVLNAGIALNSNSNFSEMDDNLEEKIIDVNTTAVIKGTKVALLHMAKRGGGSIIHVASVAGFVASP